MYLYITLVITVFILLWIIMSYYIHKAKRDVKTKNNLLSGLYFIVDMGPSVSSVSVVAIIIMPKDVEMSQLILVFILGILMKKIGRVFITLFYKVIGKD
ncbi:hypothetical protein SAMN06313486_10159 [Epsilonproteobacteria bacterium SCGC AD-308-P11]|jgi:hypothetical protein|nr:hypothetical protein SAMN06313486_10159 [Epsilonproteobacteria bacterium SCGC AD-308-P11]